MTDGLIPKSEKPISEVMTCNAIKKKYKLFEYHQDFNVSPSSLTEHRISISGYRQAEAFYDIMNDVKQYCKLNDGGGIHIHVDVSKLVGLDTTVLENFLTSKLDKVEDIFGKYTGTYNSKLVGIENKRVWVNIRQNYKSVEFRIGRCTFDYSEIMEWMIGCNNLIKEFYVFNGISIPNEYTKTKDRDLKKHVVINNPIVTNILANNSLVSSECINYIISDYNNNRDYNNYGTCFESIQTTRSSIESRQDAEVFGLMNTTRSISAEIDRLPTV